MDSQTVFAKLRDILAYLYPTTESARRIADDAGLDARRIRFSSQALENWHAILGAAVQADKVDALLHIVLTEYGSNLDLVAAYGMYRHFVEQGGRIEAPVEPEANSTVHGDVVHGDKITVGDIHKSEAVAIGHGAFAQNVRNFFFGEHEDVIRQRNRRIMLQLVKSTWIEGVLEQSLYNAVLIDLHLEARPQAVDYPWSMIIRTPDQADRPFPHGTKIVDVFEQMQQSMLILGEPGSGKTTMLLALGRDLIAQAEQDPTLPLPVVFNLSSWAEKRKPLEAWLLDEFSTKYRIPKKVAQAWIDNDELLLLLDGLDEVAQPYRTDCVKAINTFRQDHLMPMALCCRTAEQEALTSLLKLQGVVVLKPLTPQQIDSYLIGMGHKLQSVRELLRQDTTLQELAQSPLLLSIMTLAYQTISVEELQGGVSIDERRTHLFDAYITKMFTRMARSLTEYYAKGQTMHWLSWLAGRMVQHKQTLFLIEQLQPTWLQTHSLIWIYRLMLGLMLGLILGLSGILSSVLSGTTMFRFIFGLILGLILGLKTREVAQINHPNRSIWRLVWNTLITGLIWVFVSLASIATILLSFYILFFVLLFVLYFTAFGLISYETSDHMMMLMSDQMIHHVLNFLLTYGLFLGLVFGLIEYIGIAYIQHVVLRTLLWLHNYAPLNYTRFLDYCADRIFLRKVGGGYIFIHRLLMEHFASLTEEDIKRLAGSSDGR